MAMEIIFLVIYCRSFWSRPRVSSILKKVEHSLSKTPRELTDMFISSTDLKSFFRSSIKSLYFACFRSTLLRRLVSNPTVNSTT